VPTIAKADILVHYDGKNLPEEARILGEKTGRAAGDAHAKEFDRSVNDGISRTGGKMRAKWIEEGKKDGGSFGTSFTDALKTSVKGDIDDLARDFGNIFGKRNGFDQLRKQLGDLDPDLARSAVVANRLRDALDELDSNGQLGKAGSTDRYNLFRALSKDINDWEKTARKAEVEMDRIHDAADQVNEQFKQTAVNDWVENFITGGRHVDEFEGHVRALNKDFDEQNDFLKRGSQSLRGFEADLERVSPKQHELSRLFRDGKIGVEEFDRGLAALARDTGKAVGEVDKLGESLKRSGAGAAGGGRSMSLYTAAIIALVALVTLLLPEIAALGSALGALTLEGGLAFGALIVGAGAFAIALKGMFGPLKDLPNAVRPAASALQNIFGGPDAKGKFTTKGSMIAEIQDLLQTHVFQNLAGAINTVATGAFPAFRAGAISVGDALHGVASEFANAFAGQGAEGQQNIQNFQKFLVGLGPIIRELGAALIDFGNGFTGIFAAATPFVLEFAKNIHSMAESFGDFFSQQKGQDAIILWLKNADLIAPHLGGAFADIGQALHEMVTPDSIKQLNAVLDAIGRLALGLGALGVALTPAGVAISALVDLISNTLKSIGPTLTDLATGIADFFVGMEKFLRPVVDFIANTVVEPIARVIGGLLTLIGTAFGGMSTEVGGALGGLAAAVKPVTDLIADGLVNAFKVLGEVIKVMGPTLDGLGAVFLAIGKGIGTLVSAFFNVGSSVLDFKGHAGDLESFIRGPLAETFSVFGGKLQEFASYITTTVVPYVQGQLIPAFTDFWTNIQNNVIPALADMLPKLGEFGDFLLNRVVPAIEKIDFTKFVGGLIATGEIVSATIDILGNMVGAFLDIGRAVVDWGSVILHTANLVLTVIENVGLALIDLSTGNVIGAFNAAKGAISNISAAGTDLANSFQTAVSDTASAAGDFGSSARNVAADVVTIMHAGKDAFQSLSASGKADLHALSSSMDLTGNRANAFEQIVAQAAGGSKSKLAGLANDKSLAEVEHTLGLTGTKAQAFEATLAAAMSAAGGSLDKAKGHVTTLHTSISELPGGKTIVIHEDGAEAATSAAQVLKASVDALHDKTIVISTKYYNSGKSEYGFGADPYAATGGLMLGYGTGVTRAYANGGIVNTPSLFSGGSVMAGEAGPEAIVPLSGALSSVDRSVRTLSAFARASLFGARFPGSDGTSKIITIAPQIVVPSGDPVTIAGAVVDRLVPQL
jgi:hypothetical protein